MREPKVSKVAKMGTPRPPRVRHKSVGALIALRQSTQETLAEMDAAPEPARAAVKAEIASIDAQIEASSAWHTQQAADAAAFRKECIVKAVEGKGLKVDVETGNIHI